jgi:GNAT superfamily N-acetyltransferase
VERVGDWWLRRSATSSWWMATVLPHGDVDRAELDRRVAIAERFYADAGAVARFQICPGACPADLDGVLAERGYRWSDPMSLQVVRIDEIRAPAPDGLRLRVDPAPTTAWFDAWYAVHGHGSDPRAEWEMLGRVNQPSAYASVVEGGRIVAVGRGVADAGWVGVFGMATLPEARGRGAGRGVVAALAGWASSQGADGLYLQVELDNAAALRLYERAGFAELSGYHYRTATSPGRPGA